MKVHFVPVRAKDRRADRAFSSFLIAVSDKDKDLRIEPLLNGYTCVQQIEKRRFPSGCDVSPAGLGM